MRKAIILIAIVLAAAGNILACDYGALGYFPKPRPQFPANILLGGDAWDFPVSVAGISGYNPDCKPSMSASGRIFCFHTQPLNGPNYDNRQYGPGWNVYFARWNGTAWDSVVNAGPNVNPGAYPFLSPDGRKVYFDRAGDIWASAFLDTGWAAAVRLPPPVNQASSSEGTPTLSNDSRRLYFASDRVGGSGNMDIWVARTTNNGISWDSLTNCGPGVNTWGVETRPFETADRTKLYFSDFGGPQARVGFGGPDLYVSTWNGTAWGTAANAGPPINTDLVVCSAYLRPDGSTLYVASESYEGSLGDEDIWSSGFLPKFGPAKAPLPPTQASGWVRTGPLSGAKYIYDLLQVRDGSIYAATYPQGDVFRTTDGGTTWQNTAELPGALSALCLLEARDSTIYAGTYPNGDVFKTTNGGATWQSTAELDSTTGVRALLELQDGSILAGTSPNHGPANWVYKTTNGGASWFRMGDVRSGSGVWSLLENGNTVYLGGWGHRPNVWKSTNGGVFWDTTQSLFPRDPGQATNFCFLSRTPNGNLWTGGWVHGWGGYLWRSTNGGTSWDTCGRIMTRVRNTAVHAVRVYSFLGASDNSIYIGFSPGPDSVCFRSTDWGTTWQNTGAMPGAHEVLCFLEASDGSIYAGTTPNGDVFKFTASGTEEEVTAARNVRAALFQNEPNPFHYATSIRYTLPRKQAVSLRVYDALGREVVTLADGTREAGNHAAILESRNLVSGMYFYQLRTGNSILTKKLLVVR